MAEDVNVEDLDDVASDEAPKTKEEMRNVEHDFDDDTTGWCRVCGRSEGWVAHPVKNDGEDEVKKKVQMPAVPTSETPTLPAAPAVVDTLPADESNSYATGELTSDDSTAE